MGILKQRTQNRLRWVTGSHRVVLLPGGVFLVLILLTACNSNILLDSIEREVEYATAPKVPELELRTGGNLILNGDTYGFGLRELHKTASMQFSIKNAGNAPLQLTGGELVAVAPPGVFTALQPSSPIPAGGTVNFYLNFTPDDTIDYSATVTIECNDPGSPLLEFSLDGTGTTDVTGPTVLLRSPGPYEPDHLVSDSIRVGFDEPLQVSSLSNTSFQVFDVTDSITVIGSRDFETPANEAVFTPSSAFSAGHEYRVDLTTAIKDLAGNALDTSYQWHFTAKAADALTTSMGVEIAGLDVVPGTATGYILVFDQNGAALEQLSRFNFVVEEYISGTWTEVDYADLSIQKMGTAGKPKSLTFIIDNSGSVGSQGLNIERMATSNILGNTSYFANDDYGAVWSIGPPTLKWGYTQSVSDLQSAINGITIESGQGRSVETAFQALEYLYTNGQLIGLRALILNFDGDVFSGYYPGDVANLSRTYNIPIFPMGFTPGVTAFMDVLTTGGYSFYSSDPIQYMSVEAYEDIYDQLFTYLDKAYVITWNTSGGSSQRVTVNYSAQNGSWSREDAFD